jgi:formate dehydrogenase subunit gamma
MPPSESLTATSDTALVPRFTRGQRWVHWTFSLLVLGCLLTALALYFEPVATLVGRRLLVRRIHLTCGYLLPVPLLLGLLSRAMRLDTRRLNRFGPDDTRWLRDKRARRGHLLRVGKFNAGQKLNAAFVVATVVLMIVTGSAMIDLFGFWTDTLKTGATFVHDWLAFGFTLVIVGHLRLALRDRHAMAGMVSGSVPSTWAASEHPAWDPDRIES